MSCGVLVAAALQAQPLFRSAIDLVTVPVTVTPRDSTRRVGALGPADFRVYEDGRLQDVTLVSHEPRALSVCVLVDSSPSMASGRQALAIRAIDALFKGLEAEDEASMFFFAAKPRQVFPWTKGSELKPVSWLQWRLALGTALIDALKEGLRQVETAHNPLPVIVVVSDGGENISRTSLASLTATRRQSETLIYGIQTDLPPSRYAPPINRAFANFLPQIVGDSGGTILRARTPDEGENVGLALLEELRSQYTLGYASKRAADGMYHALKVEAVDHNLTVRHRAGYLAAPHVPDHR
jgi:VWFA-related protein